MLCTSYQNLNPLEKIKFIGELVTSVQESEVLFNKAIELLHLSKSEGVLEKIKIMPDAEVKSVLELQTSQSNL